MEPYSPEMMDELVGSEVCRFNVLGPRSFYFSDVEGPTDGTDYVFDEGIDTSSDALDINHMIRRADELFERVMRGEPALLYYEELDHSGKLHREFEDQCPLRTRHRRSEPRKAPIELYRRKKFILPNTA